MRRELEAALKAAGSVKELARKLRVTPSTIRRWKRRGVPKRGNAREKLKSYKEERKKERARGAEERKELKRLLALAKNQKVSLPVSRTSEGRRDGVRTSGYRWTLGIRRMLGLDVIESIEAWARSLRRRYPLWQMVVATSQFSLNENFFGYERNTVQLEQTKEARAFVQESEIGSHKSTSRVEVLGDIRGQLEDALETAGLTVFIHSVTMFNYRMRTEDEQRARATRARQERKKKWQKKQRKKKAKTSKTSMTKKRSSARSKTSLKKK